MMPQAVKVRSDIEVSCYSYEGIDAVKDALRAGLKLTSEEFPVYINLIAPPLYVVTTTWVDREGALDSLTKVIAAVKEAIEKSNGNFVVKMEPKVVTDTDEAELSKELARLEQMNAEEDEEGGGEGGEAAEEKTEKTVENGHA